MQAYSGVTRQQLQQAVGKYGKRFTHQQFDGLKSRIQNAIGERLYASAGGHLKDEHVKGIIKHLGRKTKLNPPKLMRKKPGSCWKFSTGKVLFRFCSYRNFRKL